MQTGNNTWKLLYFSHIYVNQLDRWSENSIEFQFITWDRV